MPPRSGCTCRPERGRALAGARAPDVHLVAHARETFGDLTRVVADAADIGRILAGDDVPDAHASSVPVDEETIGLVRRVDVERAPRPAVTRAPVPATPA